MAKSRSGCCASSARLCETEDRTISNDHLTGFLLGVGTTVAALYYYRKNQPQVDDFLRRQGIELPDLAFERDLSTLSLDELVMERERLEDLIAEKEQHGGAQPAPAMAPADPTPEHEPTA